MIVFRDGVCVPAQRDAGVRVSQARLDGLDVHAVCEQDRCLGMAKLMEFQAVEALRLAPVAPPSLEVVDAHHGTDIRAADGRVFRDFDIELCQFLCLPLLPIGTTDLYRFFGHAVVRFAKYKSAIMACITERMKLLV